MNREDKFILINLVTIGLLLAISAVVMLMAGVR